MDKLERLIERSGFDNVIEQMNLEPSSCISGTAIWRNIPPSNLRRNRQQGQSPGRQAFFDLRQNFILGEPRQCGSPADRFENGFDYAVLDARCLLQMG
jgi:hypothetical protein